MSAIEFINDKLSKLVKTIPYIKCIYEFRQFDNTHIIKVLPQKIFDSNQIYIDQENKIVNEFIRKFPSEGIVFISDRDLIEVKTPVNEYTGQFYDLSKLEKVELNDKSVVPVRIKIKKYDIPVSLM